MKLIVAFIALLFPLIATAGTLTIGCTAPTKWTDGTSIAAGTPMAFKFFGALQGQPKQLLTATAVSTCGFAWTVPTAGNYCAEATAIAQGTESDHSAESCSTVTPPKPMPPTLITIAQTAYTIIKTEDRFVALPVGTVPVGTACDASQPVLQFHVVPVALVKFTGTARPVVVVASCSAG